MRYLFLNPLFIFLFIVSPCWAIEKIAEVAIVKGDAFLLSLGGDLHDLKEGDFLNEADSVVTGANGRVKLLFAEGTETQRNIVVIGPNSRLQIQRASLNKQGSGTELYLEQGSVRSSVYKKYSGQGRDVFEVKTPNVVAGVRGTVFQVEYENQQSLVATFKGLVEVRNDLNSNVFVKAGEFTQALKGNINPANTLQKDRMILKRLRNFEKNSFEEEEKPSKSESSRQQSQNSGVSSKKALYGVSKRSIEERNQIERAQRLSKQLGIPIDKTVGFVRSDGYSTKDRERAVRQVQELNSGSGGGSSSRDNSYANRNNDSKLIDAKPPSLNTRQPASIIDSKPEMPRNPITAPISNTKTGFSSPYDKPKIETPPNSINKYIKPSLQ